MYADFLSISISWKSLRSTGVSSLKILQNLAVNPSGLELFSVGRVYYYFNIIACYRYIFMVYILLVPNIIAF
jgi:hypothetical protein